jgi:exopolysaccharide biosynthesis polyprenyl glycosylphosphotransferase
MRITLEGLLPRGPIAYYEEVAKALAGKSGLRKLPEQGLEDEGEAALLGWPTSPSLERRAAKAASGRAHTAYGPMLLVCDLACLSAAGWLVGSPLKDWCALAVSVVIFYAVGGLYRLRLTLSGLDDAPVLASRGLVVASLVTSAHVVLGDTAATSALLKAAPLAIALDILLRSIAYAFVRALRRRHRLSRRALILDAGSVGDSLAGLLLDNPVYGLDPIGFVDGNPPYRSDELLPLLGSQEALGALIERLRVSCVILAFALAPDSTIVETIRTCDRLNCEVLFVPRFYELHNLNRDMEEVRHFPLVRLRRPTHRAFVWRTKRLFDVLLSLLTPVVFLPLILLAMLAVRLESGPGTIFRQVRVGLDGRPFELLKIRTLQPTDETESSTQWNINHDARVRPISRFLRRFSIDELPQVFNVLAGHMSMVGPRPERPYFVQLFSGELPSYNARHRVRSGITGWAQVQGLRGDTSVDQRARLDNHYIENCSLWLDCKILLLTLFAVLRDIGWRLERRPAVGATGRREPGCWAHLPPLGPIRVAAEPVI